MKKNAKLLTVLAFALAPAAVACNHEAPAAAPAVKHHSCAPVCAPMCAPKLPTTTHVIHPPVMKVNRPTLRVQPPKLLVKPPKMKIQPPKMMVEVQPPPMEVTPPIMEVVPPEMVVRQKPLKVQPPPVMVKQKPVVKREFVRQPMQMCAPMACAPMPYMGYKQAVIPQK